MTTGKRRVITTRDIAAQCGLSTWTVAAALRGDARVKAPTAARVREVAAALGYDPEQTQAARRMLEQRHGTRSQNYLVALLFPPHGYESTDHHFFGDIFRGIMSFLVQQGYGLLCYEPLDGATKNEIPILPAFRHGDVDGLLVFPQPETLSHIAQLRAHSAFGERPVVSLTNIMEGCSAVRTDNGAGAYAAARHLLALGHRHFLQFVFPLRDDPTIETRIEAITRALGEAGLDPTTHLHYYQIPMAPSWLNSYVVQTDHGAQTANEQFVTYLREHPEITAIFALNDNNAIYARHALQQIGRQVPEDYSLVGFDDTDPILDVEGNNLLTTVRRPFMQLGVEAGQLLLCLLESEQPHGETLTLPVEFIPRGTTGPVPPRP